MEKSEKISLMHRVAEAMILSCEDYYEKDDLKRINFMEIREWVGYDGKDSTEPGATEDDIWFDTMVKNVATCIIKSIEL